jgi:hypothetical protein
MFTVAATPYVVFKELTKPRSDRTLTHIYAGGHGSGRMVWPLQSSKPQRPDMHTSEEFERRHCLIIEQPITVDAFSIPPEPFVPTHLFLRHFASCPGSPREIFLNST